VTQEQQIEQLADELEEFAMECVSLGLAEIVGVNEAGHKVYVFSNEAFTTHFEEQWQ
jgi:hypothetical protein